MEFDQTLQDLWWDDERDFLRQYQSFSQLLCSLELGQDDDQHPELILDGSSCSGLEEEEEEIGIFDFYRPMQLIVS